MSDLTPESVTLAPELPHDSAFDEWIDRYINEVLGADGYPVEGSLWFARRTGGYLVREALAGNISKTHLGLATIDSSSVTTGLNVRHEALVILDKHSSGFEEDQLIERVRDQFLGSVALRLVWDREFPVNERAFITSDATQFLSSRFSFEMRCRLANILKAHQYHDIDPEVAAEIESLFRLPPYNTDMQSPTNNEATPPSSAIKDAKKKSLAEEVVDSSQPSPAPGGSEVLVMCGMCWGQKWIYEPAQNGEGYVPNMCKTCKGKGTVPEKL